MACRYLKSVFPVVEETVLLDTLSSSDNNVHQATETLLTMGFDKRATPPPRVCLQRQAPTQSQAPSSPHPPHRMKSVEEKEDSEYHIDTKNQKCLFLRWLYVTLEIKCYGTQLLLVT